MSDIFFHQPELLEPDVYLKVGNDSHVRQTGGIIPAFSDVADEAELEIVIVVGDVNSTVLVTAKRHIPVAHVEAGLRSFDRRMPEEINRIVTDRLSDWDLP